MKSGTPACLCTTNERVKEIIKQKVCPRSVETTGVCNMCAKNRKAGRAGEAKHF